MTYFIKNDKLDAEIKPLKMKKLILCIPILLLVFANVNAQKKQDLLDEIEKLRSELKTKDADLLLSRKENKINEAKVQTMEGQVESLKANNDLLLSNMTNFTQLSSKKASNLQRTQEIIKEKDNQLLSINEALTKKNTENLKLYSGLKNTLGSDYVKIIEDVVYVIIPNSTLFGSDSSTQISESAKPLLQKVASIINTDPSYRITVEGNSNAISFNKQKMVDNWDVSVLQAASVVRSLQNDYAVSPKNMDALGRSKYTLDTVETNTRIIIDPKFDGFYSFVKANMKTKKEDVEVVEETKIKEEVTKVEETVPLETELKTEESK